MTNDTTIIRNERFIPEEFPASTEIPEGCLSSGKQTAVRNYHFRYRAFSVIQKYQQFLFLSMWVQDGFS